MQIQILMKETLLLVQYVNSTQIFTRKIISITQHYVINVKSILKWKTDWIKRHMVLSLDIEQYYAYNKIHFNFFSNEKANKSKNW